MAMAVSVLSFIWPRGGGGCHLQGRATLLHEGASLMVLTEENFARHWCMCLMKTWITTIPPWCNIWFLTCQISSRIAAILRVMNHWFFEGHEAFGGSMSNLVISSLVKKGWSSLNPQQQEHHKALAVGHLRNRWTMDSASWWHRAHKGLLVIFLLRFSLVGRVFALILCI